MKGFVVSPNGPSSSGFGVFNLVLTFRRYRVIVSFYFYILLRFIIERQVLSLLYALYLAVLLILMCKDLCSTVMMVDFLQGYSVTMNDP